MMNENAALTVITAREDGQLDRVELGTGRRCRLCPADRAGVVGLANVELVVVGSERLETLRLNLSCR